MNLFVFFHIMDLVVEVMIIVFSFFFLNIS